MYIINKKTRREKAMNFQIVIDKKTDDINLNVESNLFRNVTPFYIDRFFTKIYIGSNSKIKENLKKLKQLSKNNEIRKILDYLINNIDETTYICMFDMLGSRDGGIDIEIYLDKAYIVSIGKEGDKDDCYLVVGLSKEVSNPYEEITSKEIEKIYENLKELQKEAIELKYCKFSLLFEPFFYYLLTKVQIDPLIKESFFLLFNLKIIHNIFISDKTFLHSFITSFFNISKEILKKVALFKETMNCKLDMYVNKRIEMKLKDEFPKVAMKLKNDIKDDLYKEMQKILQNDKENKIIYDDEFLCKENTYFAELKTNCYEITYEYDRDNNIELTEYRKYNIDLIDSIFPKKIKREVTEDKVIISITYDKKIYKYLLLTIMLVMAHFITKSKVVYPDVKKMDISFDASEGKILISWSEYYYLGVRRNMRHYDNFIVSIYLP